MVSIPFFTWFYTSQVVQDFFHQQYLVSLVVVFFSNCGIRKVKSNGKIHRNCHGLWWWTSLTKRKKIIPSAPKKQVLVGGFFTNPICKIFAKNGFIFPNVRGENSKKNSWVARHPGNKLDLASSTNRTRGSTPQPPTTWEESRRAPTSRPNSPVLIVCHRFVLLKGKLKGLGFRRNPIGTLSSIWIWVKDDE